MIPKKLIEEINRWMTEGKYGNLQINFAAGKILNINRVESVKIDLIFTNNPSMNIDCTTSSKSNIA